jgi:hypothetical protein
MIASALLLRGPAKGVSSYRIFGDEAYPQHGVIREVTYPEWLTDTVMMKKANGKWRMCIDFTDLNKACPKDEFPFPKIDSLVDATTTSELMSLLDCY